MIKFNVIIALLVLLCNSCTNKNSFSNVTNDNYLEAKNQFDSILVNHFPTTLNSNNNLTVSNTNSEKNDVGLFLFEYNLSEENIKKIKKKVQSALSQYNINDSCLLIVNRFETIKTKDSLELVEIKDSSLIDKPCYNKRLPIPNFIDFSIANSIGFWEHKNFEIYVLDVGSGNHFNRFNLYPNIQMPKNWKNGFSKGIAIDETKKTVIYWSIIW